MKVLHLWTCDIDKICKLLEDKKIKVLHIISEGTCNYYTVFYKRIKK